MKDVNRTRELPANRTRGLPDEAKFTLSEVQEEPGEFTSGPELEEMKAVEIIKKEAPGWAESTPSEVKVFTKKLLPTLPPVGTKTCRAVEGGPSVQVNHIPVLVLDFKHH